MIAFLLIVLLPMLILFATLSVGWVVISVHRGAKREADLGSSLLVGLFVTSLLLFLLHLMGISPGRWAPAALLVPVAGVLVARRRVSARCTEENTASRIGVGILILLAVLWTSLTLLRPLECYDAKLFWALKAKAIFHGETVADLAQYTHPSYPLGVPYLYALSWTAGGTNDYSIKLLQVVAALGLAGIVLRESCRLLPLPNPKLWLSCLGPLALLLAPAFVIPLVETGGNADVLLATVALAALLKAQAWRYRRDEADWMAAACLFASLGWIKTEGVTIAVVGVAYLLGGLLRHRREERDRGESAEENRNCACSSLPLVLLVLLSLAWPGYAWANGYRGGGPGIVVEGVFSGSGLAQFIERIPLALQGVLSGFEATPHVEQLLLLGGLGLLMTILRRETEPLLPALLVTYLGLWFFSYAAWPDRDPAALALQIETTASRAAITPLWLLAGHGVFALMGAAAFTGTRFALPALLVLTASVAYSARAIPAYISRINHEGLPTSPMLLAPSLSLTGDLRPTRYVDEALSSLSAGSPLVVTVDSHNARTHIRYVAYPVKTLEWREGMEVKKVLALVEDGLPSGLTWLTPPESIRGYRSKAELGWARPQSEIQLEGRTAPHHAEETDLSR